VLRSGCERAINGVTEVGHYSSFSPPPPYPALMRAGYPLPAKWTDARALLTKSHAKATLDPRPSASLRALSHSVPPFLQGYLSGSSTDGLLNRCRKGITLWVGFCYLNWMRVRGQTEAELGEAMQKPQVLSSGLSTKSFLHP